MKNKNDQKSMLIFSGVIFVLSISITLFAWQKIPNDALVPAHWNIQGEVDRYASKTAGLLIGPGTILLLSILLAFLPRMEPRFENLQQSQKAYKVVWAVILLFMMTLHLITILAALNNTINIAMLMAFLLGILFMAIGNYLGKIRSNFMFGIRTPWTLASDEAWNKTHRLGGWLFFTTGLLTFLSGFFHSGKLTFSLLFGGLFLSLLILFGYSYWVWKKEEDQKNTF